MKSKKNIVCIIPARGGSKRIKNKNILNFFGKPIIYYSINEAKKSKRRVCAVGTTCMRAIETSVSPDGYLNPFDGWTNNFIFPPYDFSIADCMITNFHTPLSTLLLLISSFC